MRAVKQPVEEGDQRAVRRGIIDRAADYEPVGLLKLRGDRIDEVVAENAAPVLEAEAAGDAAPDRLIPDLNELALDALALKSADHLLQCRRCAAVGMRAAVQK